MVRRALLTLGLFLLAANASAQVGSVIRSLKFDRRTPALDALAIGDFFGCALANLGDVNGDGVVDLAVGSSGRSSIWILFLRTDGSLQSRTEIVLPFGWSGRRLAAVGDLDGDALPELATTTSIGVLILFLQADGTPKFSTLISYSDPMFMPPAQASHFGGAIRLGGLCALGDLDGDGIGDLAVGSPGDPDAGSRTQGSVWILRLRANGTLKAAQKISQTSGGFTGVLGFDEFGHALTLLGDLDSNGSPEIGVGSLHAASDRRFWVISLDPSGRAVGQTPFGLVDYGLSFSIGAQEYAALGDLDGDGVTEVAMGLPLHELPNAPQGSGGFGIGFLRTDGHVRRHLAVGHLSGGFGSLLPSARFGEAFAPLGDLDGDGALELAVGAPQDHAGAVWIFSLDPSAIRNGSGVNPVILSQASEPVIGTTWSATLDCSGHASGVAALWGYSSRTSGVFTPYGEVLVAGTQRFDLAKPHSGGPTLFQANIPNHVVLIDLVLSIQGACTGAPGARLSNALDVLVGR